MTPKDLHKLMPYKITKAALLAKVKAFGGFETFRRQPQFTQVWVDRFIASLDAGIPAARPSVKAEPAPKRVSARKALGRTARTNEFLGTL